ncbi:3-oxoacyl-ACP reductase [Kaistia algarum]|uniref:SDR family NAD(P)-dependent oxidoreductase n=1 Tax=Kaistia algarum TaxID=2083279 RepID=UPI000CE73A4C|nr:SDR family NAD(P)-dependent oxidoreductase [Kaistia algarum]MCX5515402.1 SDR family NAD(P)-dependent oxidoreductase [Kaistia algarum]PPE78535.1 3-oxoacyl-ACP reductase [Kaistia algarum]
MSSHSKTALVTGAAGAIGASIARALAGLGARVLLVDIAAAPIEALADEIPGSVPVVLDLSDTDAVAARIDALSAEFGGIDILVNNAGILSNNKAATTTIEEWRRVTAVNVDAAFVLSRGVLPSMRAKRWGRIVNISSYAAKSGGLTAGTAYSVSKASLIGLTFSIARETASEGITVNAIAPAYVMSRMISEQLTEAQRQQQLAQIPVGRFCEPEEVAHAVTFLVSPLAGFITGEVVDMNGGLHFD